MSLTKEEIIEIVNETLDKYFQRQPQSPKSRFLTTKEAAAIIKKSPDALRQIVCRGEIESIKRGNNLYFLEEDLNRWMQKGRRDPFEEKDAADVLKGRGKWQQ